MRAFGHQQLLLPGRRILLTCHPLPLLTCHPLPLRPQNLLVDDNPANPHLSCLKVADLGLGRAFSIPIKS